MTTSAAIRLPQQSFARLLPEFLSYFQGISDDLQAKYLKSERSDDAVEAFFYALDSSRIQPRLPQLDFWKAVQET